MTQRFVGIASIAALLTACSPQMSSGPMLPNSASMTGLQGASGQLVLRVRVPNGRALHGMRPAYVAPTTRAMTVQISGPTNFNKTVGLTFSSSGCKSTLMNLQCVLTVPLKSCPTTKVCYTATVATYDAISNNKIPKTAHKLSADQDFSFAITSGNTLIPLTLYGVPASVAFIPSATSSLSGTQKSGFIEPKCTASAQRVSVLGVDADGNYIVGAGAPASSLASDDTEQLTATPVNSAPGAFTLTPPKSPAYPFGGHTVHLTAKVTPSAQSGGKPQSATVDITYSGDICGTFSEFPVPSPTLGPIAITTGPDQALWFTMPYLAEVGRMTTTGTLKLFPVPKNSLPLGIVSGPDKNLWITLAAAGKIGRVTTTGAVTTFALPSGSMPQIITVGPDKLLWFADEGVNKIGKITTKGVLTEYPIPTANANPIGIVSGADDALYFTEESGDKIGRITTDGNITEVPIPGPSANPDLIGRGPDGAPWFSAVSVNSIVRVTRTPMSVVITPQYPLPEASSQPAGVTAGPDGDVWFTEILGNRVGSVTSTGVFKEYGIPSPSAYPATLVTGPDGAIWFTELLTSKIGRLR